jgi:hypothetical protein
MSVLALQAVSEGDRSEERQLSTQSFFFCFSTNSLILC